MTSLRITLIGGPTALIEVGGFRLLTDPTFDAPGSYTLPHVTLEKLSGPALSADNIGAVDAVLLSHDQHCDDLRSSLDILGFGARLKMLEPGIATPGECAGVVRRSRRMSSVSGTGICPPRCLARLEREWNIQKRFAKKMKSWARPTRL